MNNIFPSIALIPRPVLALLTLAIYGVIVRWRFSTPALIDLALLGLLIYRPSLGLAAWVGALMIVRHTPALSADVAALLRLDAFDGWTARLVLFTLPALRSLMVSGEDEAQNKGDMPVHGIDTTVALVSGIPPAARDIREEWIDRMAAVRDEKGKFLFSANDIFKAHGGHRATVMARVKVIQQGEQPAQFRQEDGNTAPAEYPVTKG